MYGTDSYSVFLFASFIQLITLIYYVKNNKLFVIEWHNAPIEELNDTYSSLRCLILPVMSNDMILFAYHCMLAYIMLSNCTNK